MQGRLGAEEVYVAGKVEGFAMLRRLIQLSTERKPYSEARQRLEASKDVALEELEEGLELLPFAEATYEAWRGSIRRPGQEDEVVKGMCAERGYEAWRLLL